MPDLKSPEHPLEVLPAMLNLVLIQTGKLLRDPDCRKSQAIGFTRGKVNEFIPPANERFHDALDEIEMKILDAKAIMERDLSKIRKKRALREGIKIPSKAATPNEIPVEEAKQTSGEVGKTETDKTQTVPEDNDLQMIDINEEIAGLTSGVLQNEGEKAITTGQGMPQDAENSAGLAISLPTDSKGIEKTKLNAAETATQETSNTISDNNISTDQPSGEQAGTDFDFESMFNDADFSTADGGMDFSHMDFSTTATDTGTGAGTGNQDNLADNTFETIAITSADLANVASTTNEDINSLLPGLDDYLNTGDVTAAAGANPVAPLPEAGKTATDAAPPEEAKPAEPMTQFDDLFGNDTFDLAGTGTEGGMGDGNLADFDFDEEWLKM